MVTAALLGPDLLIVLLLIPSVAMFAISIWAIVDAAQRPADAFRAAGTNKALWISLIAVLTFFCGVGTVVAIIYLASIRPRVTLATPK